MNDHTQAIIDAMQQADSFIPGDDEGAIAYYLRDWFADPMDDDCETWIAENVPCWVIHSRVNWAEVARNVQQVAA